MPAAVEVQQTLASETVVWRRGILVMPPAIHEVSCTLCWAMLAILTTQLAGASSGPFLSTGRLFRLKSGLRSRWLRHASNRR